MSTDIERLRRDASLSDVAAQCGVNLQRDGNEWVACCPFHAEDTPSFTIFTGKDHIRRFHCFGCGERGDVLDFVQAIKGVDIKEAIRILGGGSAGPNIAPRHVEVRDIYEGITPLDPAGTIVAGRKVTLYNPKRVGTDREWGSFTPSMVFPYCRADGSVSGYVLRHDLPDGGKETPMVAFVRLPDGRECWSRFPFAKPRPLYRLDLIGDARQVFLAEGEKCADALAKATGRVFVSWAGGSYGINHTDWTPLRGLNVVAWPDADAAGVATMAKVGSILADIASTYRTLVFPCDGEAGDGAYSFEDWQAGKVPPKGWDGADAVRDGWAKADIDAFMKVTATIWSPPRVVGTPVERPSPSAGPTAAPVAAKPVREARTVQQELPATVTDIRTRKTVAADDAWMANLVTNEEGKAKPGVTKNWSLFLENHRDTAGVFAFDAFKRQVTLMRRPPWETAGASWEPRVLQDRDYSESVFWLEQFHLTPKASNIAAVIQMIAERSSFDRLVDYLRGLVWDGKPRVATWVRDYLGAKDTPYARTIGTHWLVSAVARGLKPGCKVDTMPILEGPQGLKKSAAIEYLFGKQFFTDELSEIGSKDAMIELQGVWGVEVAEMARFRLSDADNIKKFLSRKIDRYRPPYGRTVVEAPRRCVLNGTINPEGNPYLRDPTGARRFWPIECGRIDLGGIEADRDQLWAEAVHLFDLKTPYWVQDDEQAAVEQEQEKRTDVDVWTEIIASGVRTRSTVTQLELLKMLSIPDKDAGDRQGGRIGRIMRKLGWKGERDRSQGEDRLVFRRVAEVDEDEPSDDRW